MKKLLLTLLLLLCVACNSTKVTIYDGGFSSTRQTCDTIQNVEFCDYCRDYNISCTDSLWIPLYGKDYETKKSFFKKMYIQQMDSIEVIYMYEQIDSIYGKFIIKKSL